MRTEIIATVVIMATSVFADPPCECKHVFMRMLQLENDLRDELSACLDVENGRSTEYTPMVNLDEANQYLADKECCIGPGWFESASDLTEDLSDCRDTVTLSPYKYWS